MPLLFFIDKDVLDDPACRNLDDIVLSYTFFKWVSVLIIWIAIIRGAHIVTQGETECTRPTGTRCVRGCSTGIARLVGRKICFKVISLDRREISFPAV